MNRGAGSQAPKARETGDESRKVAAGGEVVAVPGICGEHVAVLGGDDVSLGVAAVAVVAIDGDWQTSIEVVFETVEPGDRFVVDVEIENAEDGVGRLGGADAGAGGATD